MERDMWYMTKQSGAVRAYCKDDPDGKIHRVFIHFHPGKTYGDKLIKKLVASAGWTVDDLVRLKLVKGKGFKRG